MSMLIMSSQPQPSFEPASQAAASNPPERRQNLVRILFINRYLADVERCLHELKRLRYTVSSDVVLTPGQFTARLHAEAYDTIIAEYPSSNWQETQALDILHNLKKDIPLVFLAHGLKREMAAELILKGAADCIEVDSIGHLPVAVHRALEEKVLRDQRDRAEKDLRRSAARYRALVGNRSYGICRCSLDGRFLEVNEAILRMLGYDTRQELLAQDLAREMIQDPGTRAGLLGQAGPEASAEPV